MRLRRADGVVGIGFILAGLLSLPAGALADWTFVDVTAESQINYTHGYTSVNPTDKMMIAGGVVAGDYDRDGWVDLFIPQGDIGPNLLYRNLGTIARFREKGVEAGVAVGPDFSCGGVFADIDGDGWLDLIVGGILGDPASVFLNNGDGTFADVTATAGVDNGLDQFSFALADIDGDQDLDMACGHWTGSDMFERPLSVWTNDGDGNFTDVSAAADVSTIQTFAFAPNFSDIDDDGWLDLLVASDFGTSVILMNDGDFTFTQNLSSPITDENGMGASVGDYDNDGIFDWFVTSIWDPDQTPEGNWGITGNRLYRGLGGGLFEDVTDAAGVREGYWGWASCFADFNNDGHLDLFHVNGFPHISASEFHNDPARMFVSNGNGTFTERSTELGVDDTGQGRGIVCFDYDRDGDIDIFISNNAQPPKLYRNDGGNDGNYLALRLAGLPPNTEGIGARIYVTVGASTQMRDIRAGSNFASNSPAEAHFGLGTATVVDEVRVEWPNCVVTVLVDVPAGQLSTISQANGLPPAVPDGSGGSSPMTVDKLDVAGTTLSLAWDMATCTDADSNQILVGGGSQLPNVQGGLYAISSAVCGIGTVSPHTWSGVPDAASDPEGLLWWVLVANDGASTEGSWGKESAGSERDGPGTQGASAQCGVLTKDLLNTCGQ